LERGLLASAMARESGDRLRGTPTRARGFARGGRGGEGERAEVDAESGGGRALLLLLLPLLLLLRDVRRGCRFLADSCRGGRVALDELEEGKAGGGSDVD
jgi:hypothetical protein